MSTSTIQADRPNVNQNWIDRCIEALEKPYRSEAVLVELYTRQEMSTREIADVLGCGRTTVWCWLDKYGIETRDAVSQRVERASHTIEEKSVANKQEKWQVYEPDGVVNVRVSQLLAIADGEDPADVFDDGTHVHHTTGCGLVNVPGYVEVVDHSEHMLLHNRGDFVTDERGFPVLTRGTLDQFASG